MAFLSTICGKPGNLNAHILLRHAKGHPSRWNLDCFGFGMCRPAGVYAEDFHVYSRLAAATWEMRLWGCPSTLVGSRILGGSRLQISTVVVGKQRHNFHGHQRYVTQA